MDIVELVRTRYTTKHYDPARRISDRDIADLMEVLRLSPSSVNSQPWHFFVTGTDEGKARVMPAVLDFNRPRVADASHLVVFAVPVEFTEERFRRLVAQELADGRVTAEDAVSGAADAGRRHFVGLHQVTQRSSFPGRRARPTSPWASCSGPPPSAASTRPASRASTWRRWTNASDSLKRACAPSVP